MLSRVHAYDSKITVENTTFYDIILDNSSVFTYDLTVVNQMCLRTSYASLNVTSVNTGYIYSSEIAAVNNTYFNYLYPTKSNLSFVSSIFIELHSTDSKINLENATETSTEKTFNLRSSEIAIKNVDLLYISLTANTTSISITDSTVNNPYKQTHIFELRNSTAQTFNSTINWINWHPYENAELHDSTSSLARVYVYGPNANLSLEDDILFMVSFETDANSTGLLNNTGCSKLYTVQPGDYRKTNNKVIVKNSTIGYYLSYSVSVYSGTVNIVDHRVTGSGVYHSSAEIDNETKLYVKPWFEAHLVYLYAEGGVITVENTTRIDYAEVQNTQFTAKNVTIEEAYMTDTQYTIVDTTFGLLLLGFTNWKEFDYAIKHGKFITHPSNGSLFNTNIDLFIAFSGQAWIANATIKRT